MFFSIIVPIFNSQSFIKKCIESIKQQTFTDFECLLINDGSTDNSENIINKEINNDSRFILINKKNNGVSSARNYGLNIAKGDFIVFIDSDDWIEPNLLQEINEHADGNNIIQYDFYKVSKNKSGKLKKEIHIKSDINMILQGEGAVVWKRAIKRTFIEGLRFDESLSGGEDYLFCSNVFLKDSHFAYIDKCLYNYNISNENSAMSKKTINIFIDQLIATKKVEAQLQDSLLLEEYYKDINERYFWCLAEFNNWWLKLKNKGPVTRRIIVKIIKMILRMF